MEPTIRLNIKVPTDLHRAFKAACAQDGQTQTAVILRFLEAYAQPQQKTAGATTPAVEPT